MMVDSNWFLAALDEQQLLAFRDRGRRQSFKSQFVKRSGGSRKLALAAVYQNKIRQWLVLAHQSRVAPSDHFIHRLEIVRSTFDRPHFEFAIVGLLHRSVLAHNHRRDVL